MHLAAARAPAALLLLLAGWTLAETPCPFQHSVDIQDGHLLSNGSLLDRSDHTLYPRGLFWRDSDTKTYRGCICKLKSCIRKCCPRYAYREEQCATRLFANRTKTQMDEVFNVTVFLNETALDRPLPYQNTFQRFGVVYEEACKDRYRLEPHEVAEDEFFVLQNGSLWVPALEPHTGGIIGVDEYCLDYFDDVGAVMPLVCFPQEPVAPGVVFTMYPVGMLLSTVFMVITLAVYALLPELRNLHGKLVMCHVASLLVAYLSLALVQLGTTVIPMWLCQATAFMIEFTFAAAFFWLNIMCFDICWMFSGMSSGRVSAERERRKLIFYSVYAWGCPLVLLVVCLIMQYAPVPEHLLRPQFGEERCWFKEKMAIFAYFFGPISLLLLCNLVLFILTAVRIVRLRRGTAVLKAADSQRSAENQQRFVLYLKLFLVMGMTWIMEVVSWTVGGSQWLWIVTDVCNTLQGLAIFLIFVWKPKVRRLLKARLMSKKRPASVSMDPSATAVATRRVGSSKRANYDTPDSGLDSSSSRPVTQATSLIMEDMPDVARVRE